MFRGLAADAVASALPRHSAAASLGTALRVPGRHLFRRPPVTRAVWRGRWRERSMPAIRKPCGRARTRAVRLIVHQLAVLCGSLRDRQHAGCLREAERPVQSEGRSHKNHSRGNQRKHTKRGVKTSASEKIVPNKSTTLNFEFDRSNARSSLALLLLHFNYSDSAVSNPCPVTPRRDSESLCDWSRNKDLK